MVASITACDICGKPTKGNILPILRMVSPSTGKKVDVIFRLVNKDDFARFLGQDHPDICRDCGQSIRDAWSDLMHQIPGQREAREKYNKQRSES